MSIQVVILAAGLGKRMHSKKAKVLHTLAGNPLLEHVINMAMRFTEKPIVVNGHQGSQLQDAFKDLDLTWATQEKQLGTGHAVAAALPFLKEENRVLILYGDVPLISHKTLTKLINDTPETAIGMLTAEFQNPTGYGRIKRSVDNNIIGVVEEKDAKLEEKKITEINTGIFLVPVKYLIAWLPRLENHNAQKEYYLPDIIRFAISEKIPIYSVTPEAVEEVYGVNDCLQLANLERYYQKQFAKKLMQSGVTLRDPDRFDVRGDLYVGRDVIIDVNVILSGRVVIGDDCEIGANTILKDTVLGKGVIIKDHCHLEGAEIGDECVVGPFARLRPGTHLEKKVHVGNFVELKNSFVDEFTKVNHLSYVGDSEIGKRVNIGAGVITCNYDGVKKHKTIIKDNVFIGSDTQLVAPVTIAENAVIGAGSTIAKDVLNSGITITTRLEQRQLPEKR